ncbi:hypothetical protein HAX54_032361, partial [Datura stramonium]|nr:hypothetical protein [Datura stramonium]
MKVGHCIQVRDHDGEANDRYYDVTMLVGFSIEKLFIRACVILLMNVVSGKDNNFNLVLRMTLEVEV